MTEIVVVREVVVLVVASYFVYRISTELRRAFVKTVMNLPGSIK
jgi:hypothetical protein